MLKVVLDTNLIASATISPKGLPGQIVMAWFEGIFELIISPQILHEMEETLFSEKIKKYRVLSDAEVLILLSEIQHDATLCHPKTVINAIKDDPDDNKFLECAVEAKANYIVSGDKHLKKLGSFQGIKILSPAEFLEIVK